MPEEKIIYCDYCKDIEAVTTSYDDKYNLCEDCDEAYDNKTGWCGLSCCITGRCDSSC